MPKDDTSREISELLEQLRGNVAEEGSKKPAPDKKAKKMTDDDVKALLKKYYGDKSELPEEKEPSFVIDTSDFVSDEPEQSIEPEPEPEPEPESDPDAKPESVQKSEPEVKPEAEPGVERVSEPEIEIATEPELVPEPNPEVAQEVETISDPEIEPVSEQEPETVVEVAPEPEPEPEPEEKPNLYQEFRIEGSSTIYNCDVSRFYKK